MRKPCCCDRGACCHLDETCEITTQENCEEQCGEFHLDLPCLECEDDSNCMGGNCINGECDNGVDCTYERGPCCFCESDFSDCIEDLTEPECELGESSRTCVDGELVIEYEWEEGVWQGPDHTCEDSCDCQDETGACCCTNDCTDDVSEQECVDNDCQYLGDDSNCSDGGLGTGAGQPDGPSNCGWDAWCYPDGCDRASREANCNTHPDCQYCDAWNAGMYCEELCCMNGYCFGNCVWVTPDYPPWHPDGLNAWCGEFGGEMQYDRCYGGEEGTSCDHACPCKRCGIWDPQTHTCVCPDEGDFGESCSYSNCSCYGCCIEKGACWKCDDSGFFRCSVKGQSSCREHQGYHFVAGKWCDEVPESEGYCGCGVYSPCPQEGACCAWQGMPGQECMWLTECDCDDVDGEFAGIGNEECPCVQPCVTDEDCDENWSCDDKGNCVDNGGACCLWASSESYCEIYTQEDCEMYGGVYAGDGTTECPDCDGGGGGE